MRLVELPGNETFASAPITSGQSAGMPQADLFWIDDHTVEYGVYKPTADGTQMQFVEKRRIAF